MNNQEIPYECEIEPYAEERKIVLRFLKEVDQLPPILGPKHSHTQTKG